MKSLKILPIDLLFWGNPSELHTWLGMLLRVALVRIVRSVMLKNLIFHLDNLFLMLS